MLTVNAGCVDFSRYRRFVSSLFRRRKRWKSPYLRPATVPFHQLDAASDRDNGVSGVLLDYNLFASRYQPDEGQAAITSIPTGPLAPTGRRRLRGDYQYALNRTDGRLQSDGRLSRAYLFRPLPALGSKFTLGESDFQSDIFDGFSYTGASLISDERMLPRSLRGYAPQILVLLRRMPP